MAYWKKQRWVQLQKLDESNSSLVLVRLLLELSTTSSSAPTTDEGQVMQLHVTGEI